METADFQQTQYGRASGKAEKIQKPEPAQINLCQHWIDHYLIINSFYLVSLPASNDHHKNRNCTCGIGDGYIPVCLQQNVHGLLQNRSDTV